MHPGRLAANVYRHHGTLVVIGRPRTVCGLSPSRFDTLSETENNKQIEEKTFKILKGLLNKGEWVRDKGS